LHSAGRRPQYQDGEVRLLRRQGLLLRFQVRLREWQEMWLCLEMRVQGRQEERGFFHVLLRSKNGMRGRLGLL
jgi:hypothetical protein